MQLDTGMCACHNASWECLLGHASNDSSPQSPSARKLKIIIHYTIVFIERTVLEPHGQPVTGTPSISLISNIITYRWNIYEKDGVPVIFLIK